MSFRAFSIDNLGSHTINRAYDQPWLTAPALPAFETREDYKRWLADNESVVPLFNLVEGENSAMRVSASNPAYRVHGVVVDYDAAVTDAELDAGIARMAPEYPAYAYNRSRRGGVHAVWRFESPVYYYGPDTFKRFMKRVIRELRLSDLWAGLDEEILYKPEQTYAAGAGWRINEPAVISNATLGLWLFDALRQTRDYDKYGIEIPLDVVEKAANERFPGRWVGSFTEGARGLRFWDPAADNPTAAVIKKTGCVCYTGDKPFMSWADIFGREFVAKYQEDRIGRAVSELYADDTNHYYRPMPGGNWNRCEATVMRRHLRAVYALSDNAKGGELSEVERALHHLELYRHIDGMLPFPHTPESIVDWNGRRYLNIARAELVKPAETDGAFSFIDAYLNNLFVDDKNRDVFLAWLQLWYKGCLEGKPQQGHAMFLVGPPGTGKSFLSLELLASIFGGYANAASFFVEGSKFNDSLFEKAIWALDDQTVLGDRKMHSKFSALVKACVANPSMSYAMKYGYEGQAPFWGRFITTLNDDPVSIGILPNTDGSLLDKVLLLRTGTKEAPVHASRAKNHETVMAELPYFLRWLLNWSWPSFIQTDTRYGMKSWHDNLVRQEAEASSDSSTVLQTVEEWLRNWTDDSASAGHDNTWRGTASTLLELLRINHGASTRQLTAVSLGRHLNHACNTQVMWLRRSMCRGRAFYHLNKDLLPEIDLTHETGETTEPAAA